MVRTRQGGPALLEILKKSSSVGSKEKDEIMYKGVGRKISRVVNEK